MSERPETTEAATPSNQVDMVIEAHGGDTRAAIAGLVDDMEYLRDQMAFASLAVSRGYPRGWLPSYERIRAWE